MKVSINALMQQNVVGFGTSGARGPVDSLTNEFCYALTLAFMQQVVTSQSRSRQVIIGHDLRPSSPAISAACIAALQATGAEVIYAGALPTPALAWYGQQLHAPVVVVTGSHIPFDRNGIKFYSADGEITKQHEAAIVAAEVDVPEDIPVKALPAVATAVEQSYLDRYLAFFPSDMLQGQRIAIYEHSGVGRDLIARLLKALGADLICLGRTDEFVPIDTEAVSQADVQMARQWAHQHHFDAILSTDGDADRPLIGDEQGNWLRGDLVGLLCSAYLQADTVVTPVSCNTAIEKSGLFKAVIRTRIGSPYVIAGMEQALAEDEKQIVVGFEANGGYLLGSDVNLDGKTLAKLPTRDALYPMLAVLAMAHQRQLSVSALAADLPARYTASDRIQNYATSQSAALLSRLQADPVAAATMMAPQAGEVIETNQVDGLRLTFANGDIVHLRPSGNAPELRCYAESDSAEAAEQLCQSCLHKVHEQ